MNLHHQHVMATKEAIFLIEIASTDYYRYRNDVDYCHPDEGGSYPSPNKHSPTNARYYSSTKA